MTPWPLSVAFPLTLAGSILLILACDILGALAARKDFFAYKNLWPVQFAIYILIGFVAMLTLLDLRLVEAVGAITGFVEQTLGWAITWRMGPSRLANPEPAGIAVAILAVTAFAFGFSIVGALLFNLVARILLHGH